MKRLIPFVMVTLIVASCTSSDSTYTVETIDGVRYVHNHAPAWGDEPKAALELIRKFGEVGSEDESGYLFNPFAMAKDSKGNVYVLEVTDAQIEKFAPDGTHIGAIGRKGQGPGEMMMPYNIDIDRNDNIVVFDFGNQRFQVFSPEGEDLGSRRTRKRRMLFRILSTGDIVAYLIQNESDEYGHTFERFDTAGNVKLRFGKRFDYGGEETLLSFQDLRFAVTEDDCVVSSFRTANCLEKYSPDGALLFRADRPLKFDLNYEIRTTNTPVSDGSSRPYSYRITVSEEPSIDYKGRIWLVTHTFDPSEMRDNPSDFEPGERFDWYIFDADGVFLGEIDCHFDSFRFRIYGDRLYLIERVDEMVVYEYRIVDL
ncbi:6-bladed beta-propeller [candidate division KSB1 bacterium]